MKTKLNFKQSLFAGLYAAVASASVNAILFLISHAAHIIVDTIQVQPNQPLTVVPVIISSIIPSIIGSIFFFLLEKFTNKGFMIFSVLSVVLTLLSLVIPFFVIAGVTTGYALALAAMHLVVLTFLLYVINRTIKTNQKDIR